MNIITSEGGLNLLTEDADPLITEQDEAGIIQASGSFGVAVRGSGSFGVPINARGSFGVPILARGSI